MKDETEVHVAWEIWNLIARLNDLIWDRYEEDFIDIYLSEEEKKYFNSLQQSAIQPPDCSKDVPPKPISPGSASSKTSSLIR